MSSISHVSVARCLFHSSFPHVLIGSSLRPCEVGRQAMHDHAPFLKMWWVVASETKHCQVTYHQIYVGGGRK